MKHYLLKDHPMHERCHHRIIIMFIVFVMMSIAVYSQEKRPKIGLVLSGGGAKGLAHIGVIKEMEKAGLRPDYITGTSMGSVVGGLYAMGYSPQDLEDIVNRVDWDEVLTNKIPLSEITIEEKPYYNRYIAEVPLSSPFKVSFPPGIIEGQKLVELLLDLTRPVHDVEDFNKLSIPFACIATDISTGRAVILNKGSLAQCMRASMAIPGVFTPVEIDGKLLVDGGLVRNFPVQEVIDMGADIVIGVFVSDDLKKKEELSNFISILFQSSWVMSSYDTREQKEHVNMYIEPVNTGYGTADFNMSEEIIHQGELIGNEFFPAFKKLADSVYALGPKKAHKKPETVDSYFINTVDISGNNRIPADLIRRKLAIKEKSVVTSREVERKVTLLFGTQHFNSVGYHLHKVDSGYNLVINTKEAPPGKIKGAVHYDSENKAGININYTLRNALFANSRAVVEVDLAEYPRVDINYLKYIRDQQDLAAMIRGEFNSFQLRIEEGETRGDYKLNQYAITGNIFTTASTNHSYGISFADLIVRMKPQVGPQFDYIRNNSLGAQAWYQLNTFERPFYARRGSKAWASISAFFNTSLSYKVSNDTMLLTDEANVPHTFRTDLSYTRIIPLHRTISIVGEARMALSTVGDQPTLNAIGNSYFGGFRPRVRDSYAFYGANSFDYSAYTYVLMKADIQTEIIPKLFLTTGVNFVSIEYPMAWFHREYNISGNLQDGKHWRLGYGASLGYLSVIGPISLSGAIDQDRGTFIGNFALGFYF